MEQISLSFGPQRRVFTVSQLADAIRAMFDGQFGDMWVSGEISGVKLAPSGHCYFTLKDEQAQLRSVCYRGDMRFLRFKPHDGLQVVARGRLDMYASRGDLQFIVTVLEPRGHGALQVAFEQLKKKLAAEGLFDAARKRPLPPFPRRIGLVTSPTGAVIQDMIGILSRRFPGLHIFLYPAQVQGEGSIEQVCRGIRFFSRSKMADVVIVARGGGSLEDLWTFNEEAVARAIVACSVPVISAVGHDTDFTIADFVADLRAPTPSAAAELVVPTRAEVLDRVVALESKLRQQMRIRIGDARRRLHQLAIDRAASLLHRAIGRRLQRIDELEYRLREKARFAVRSRRQRVEQMDARLRRQDLRLRMAEARRRMEAGTAALSRLMNYRLVRARARLEPLAAHLAQLSPLRILERGYAIVQDLDGGVIKEPGQAPPGTALTVRLAKGQLRVTVM